VVGLLVLELNSYFPVENFFVALVDFAHSDYCYIKDWGGFATLHCRCWSTDCSLENNYFGPYSSPTLDL
jgi:hypothetical protein